MSGLTVLCGSHHNEKAAAAFALYNYDGDGFITKDEMTRYLTSVFRIIFHAEPGMGGSRGCSPAELAAVTVEEAFGAVLGTLGGDASVPWIVTDDHWSYDLNKSHFHNLLQTASQKVSRLPSRSRAPRLPAAIETVGCCRGTNLTSTC